MKRLESVFLRAVQEPTQTGQAAILDDECADDGVLRSWVLEMLRKHELPEQLMLDTPVFDSLTPPPVTNHTTRTLPIELPCGTIIAGRYRLLERLGQGGMGTVYRAEQIFPVQRIFALKVIKPGLDSNSLLSRFESEWQALAKMDHPNIAKIHDSGIVGNEQWAEGSDTDLSAAHGSLPTIQRPFFVMEYVVGLPITQFCNQEKLTLRQRIELFIPVCRAIEHAHQKGVIHRDLKPGNILVTKRDRPVPVVIDFGIAKCIDGPIDKVTHHTGWGLFLGTLDYMAPEQAVGNSKAVDTRTDVYALGAVLYELLTGRVPLDRESAGESVFDLVTLLVEQEPLPPSVRVGRRNESQRTEDRGQKTELRGELDWIVMKCLEKVRDRRYPSARSLADDLTRYLANEPVMAGPPTAGYRIRKYIRRHVGGVVAACCVLVALIGGIAGTTWGMIQARKAEAVALQALGEKETARANEEQERIRADAKAAQAKFVSDFIQFDVIRQANPRWQSRLGFTPDANLTVREALDRAGATIEKRFGDKPHIVAALLSTVGTSYDGLGEYVTAIKHLQRSFELYAQLFPPEDDRTISARHLLAQTLEHAKRTGEAIPLFEQNLRLIRAKFGTEHNKTLTAETDLANAYRDVDRFEDAGKLLSHVYETVRVKEPNSPRMIHTLINLAGLDECRGQFDEAIRKIESLNEHLQPGQELDSLAKFTVNKGLGRFYLEGRRNEEGIRFLESARESAQTMFGEEHFQYFTTITILADAYLATGRPGDALQLLETTRKNLQAKLQLYDVRVYQISLELARMSIEAGDLNHAEKLASETTMAALDSNNSDSHIRGQALSVSGRCLYLTNRVAEAEPIVREALAILLARQPDDNQTHATRILFGQILLAQGRIADAELELNAGYQELKKQGHKLFFATRRRLPEALDGLAKCAESMNRPVDAERWRAERERLGQTARK